MPFASATAKAASSLITNQYDQAMEWQKAQGQLALSMAQAKHYDSETDYNNKSLQLRLAGLDTESRLREAQIQEATNKNSLFAATVDAQIKQKQQEAENEGLVIKQNQYLLDEDNRKRDELKKAQDERSQALAELPTMDDPDFFAKKAESVKKYPNAWNNLGTKQSMADAYTALEDGMRTNAVVLQRNQNFINLQKAKDAGTLPGDADVHALSLDPNAANNALVQSRIVGSLQQAQRIINRLPATVAPEYQLQAAQLRTFRDQLKTILGDREQGMSSVTSGFHGDMFDTNGNLNPELQGDLQALEDYTSQVSKEGGKAMGVLEIRQGIGTPDPLTGKYQSYINSKETVPIDQMEQRRQTLLKQVGPGGSVTVDKTSHSGGTALPAPMQQQLSNALQQRMATDPGFRPMVDQAQKTGNWIPVYEALGIGMPRTPGGMQEGGLIGTNTGLMKQGGGIIFNPATAAGSTDTVPAMLSPGEYVVNAPAVAAVGQGTLDQINQAGHVSSSPNITDPLAAMTSQMARGQQQPTAGRTQAQPTTAQPTSQGVTPWWGGKNVTPWYGTQPQEPKSVSQPSETAQSVVPEAAAVAAAARTPSQVEPTSPIGGNWRTGVGTEFGEVDNPVYGGYTEPGWNRGKWGDNISGWDTEGVALPNVPHGTLVEVMNPKTGQMTTTTVKDSGPGAETGAAIDLLAGTRAKLGLPRNFKGQVQFRILSSPTAMAQGYQRGGLVSEEGSIGTRGERGGFGSPRVGGTGGGIEAQLDAPVDPKQRHRRFHPRVGAAGQLGGLGADIPDPMQKKLAKLSQGYLSGLSDLIQQNPEIGPALLHHARHQLAANMGGQPGDWMAEGGGTEQQQMRQAAPSVPPEAYGGGMTAYGGSGGGGEEAYMRRGGPVGYQAGGPVMPEDVMNMAMLDPEAFGIGTMQRGGLVRPTHHSNLLTAAYQGLYR